MDETRVYAVASGKGGVGKTTTAVALGACAVAAGRSAVVVDADLGMGNLATLLGVADEGPTLHDVLAGEADATDAIHEGPGGLDVVASGHSLAGYAAADPTELGGVVEALRERYEVVVLDTGAGLSHDTVLPLGLADEVLLVTTPAAIALDNTEKTSTVAERIDTTVRGAVVTRATEGRVEGVEADLGVPVLGTVPEDDAVAAAAAAGVPVTAHAPESPAAGAYADAAAALFSVPVTALDFGGEREASAERVAAVPFEGDDQTADEGSAVIEDAEGDGGTADDERAADGAAGDGDVTDGAAGADAPAETEGSAGETDAEGEDAEGRSLLSKLSGGLLG